MLNFNFNAAIVRQNLAEIVRDAYIVDFI